MRRVVHGSDRDREASRIAPASRGGRHRSRECARGGRRRRAQVDVPCARGSSLRVRGDRHPGGTGGREADRVSVGVCRADRLIGARRRTASDADRHVPNGIEDGAVRQRGSAGAGPVEPVPSGSTGHAARVGGVADHVGVREEEPITARAESRSEPEWIDPRGSDLNVDARGSGHRRYGDRSQGCEPRGRERSWGSRPVDLDFGVAL